MQQMWAWAWILILVAIGLLIGVFVDWHRTDVPGVGVAWIATPGTITLAVLAGSAGIGGIVLFALARLEEWYLTPRDARSSSRRLNTPSQVSPPREEWRTPTDDS